MVSSRLEREVLIVSGNLESARQLQGYFESRAVVSTVAGKLPKLPRPAVPRSLVLFPDELKAKDIDSWVIEQLALAPYTQVTIVTGNTQRFENLYARIPTSEHQRLTVLPRPAFSWTILDHVKFTFPEHPAKGAY